MNFFGESLVDANVGSSMFHEVPSNSMMRLSSLILYISTDPGMIFFTGISYL